MELPLLAASLRSREDFDLILDYVDLKMSTYSKELQVVMSKVKDYYTRDPAATFVLPEVLIAQIAETIRNPKHVALFSELIASAVTEIGSDSNVRAVVLLAKQQEAGDKLAQALASGITGRQSIDELLLEVQKLRAMTELGELVGDGMESYRGVDLAELMRHENDPSVLIKMYPSSLNARLDGGAKRGHHVTVYARPEVGKSQFCVNLACGMARDGRKSSYFINEDRPQDIIMRMISNLSGMNKRQVYDDMAMAQELANNHGFQNITIINAKPGTIRQIEDQIEKDQPDVIFVDQLRNLEVKAESRVNQLESAATAVRGLAKVCNVLAVSVTQAGDSASNKAVLEMSDVDFSNTGIPSQADLMIGIGMDHTLEAEGRRMISLPKNKISGDHSSFPVNVNPSLSRYTSV